MRDISCRVDPLVAIAALLIFSLFPSVQTQAARLPSANRECAICHIMWLTEFKRQDLKPLVPYNPRPTVDSGKQDIVSTKRMCFSCHDGFVLDSRFMWKDGGHSHPVGQAPSENIKIPIVAGKELYPLNDDGHVYCGTCHTAHGVDWAQSDAPIFMRVTDKGSGELCKGCHKDKLDGAKHGDHSVFGKLDTLPAALVQAGGKTGGGKAGASKTLLCQSCHRPHAAATESLLLIPNGNSQLCGTCHADHYPNNRAEAARMGTHPINVRPAVAKVPDRLSKGGAILGSGDQVICQTCHKPHNATAGKGLLVAANRNSALCQDCHRPQRSVTGGKHDMRLVDGAAKNVRGEMVDKAGVCSACHVPHKGVGPKMWARRLASGPDPMATLCTSCHGKGGLASRHQAGANSHPVGVKVANLGHSIKLPAFTATGVRTKDASKGLVSCASCHDAHRWDPANPQHNAKPGAASDNTNRFLRKANGTNSALCLTCHQRPKQVRGTKHDLTLTAPRSSNRLKQRPAQSGVCGACHIVHKAGGPFLWARNALPRTDPASAACKNCHKSGGLAKKKRIGKNTHPTGMDLKSLPVSIRAGRWRSTTASASSKKRLTPLPLFNAQGRPAHKGGNVACGTCHDPHVWSQAGGVSGDPRRIEGSADDSFLRISDGGKSALCINCHVDKASVADSKHNVSTPATRQGPERGVCSDCHSPHNAARNNLWARATGPGKGPTEVLCNDCHKANGSAKDKLITGHSHPTGIELRSGMKSGVLPLFSATGNRPHGSGVIDCATCHDPHRWSPTPEGMEAASRDNEGDGRNSFLRLAAAPAGELCITCHRKQGAVRGTDHDLAVTAPTEVNRHGQQVTQSGVCGQCHTPHNAATTSTLWARDLNSEARDPGGAVFNVAQQRCASCHRADGIAENKQPLKTQHPATVKVWSTALQKKLLEHKTPDIPVYSLSGKQVQFGAITCSSCHDPHRWDPANDSPGKGANVEGDVRTSFLRNANSAFFTCADCHGADALFRYKYFHDPASRRTGIPLR